jgi:hypothetical protein
MPNDSSPATAESGFGRFWFRVTACHMVSYFIAGILAYTLMNYKGLFQTEGLSQLMRPIDSPWVAIGPALQVFRGLVLAAVLYPFRHVLFEEPKGWWRLFALVVGLSVLSASGPAPSSLEGIVYTKLTLMQHLQGLPELLLQNLMFAWALVAWSRRPSRPWTICMSVMTGLVVILSVLGALAPRPGAFR